MSDTAPFAASLFAFLRQLAKHNTREWFTEHRSKYERDVKGPALAFIRAFASPLAEISSHFRADPRPVGGSLFRIHRDTRFSRDKRPYKTAVGIQFRHEQGKDAHAPGFYLHLEPESVFAGVGIWRPDTATLGAIRNHIVEHPVKWTRATRRQPFTRRFTLSGDSLKRAPRGQDPEHPLIEDLKRKDFVGLCELDERLATSRGFLRTYARICREGSPLVNFLCEAVGVPF